MRVAGAVAGADHKDGGAYTISITLSSRELDPLAAEHGWLMKARKTSEPVENLPRPPFASLKRFSS